MNPPVVYTTCRRWEQYPVKHGAMGMDHLSCTPEMRRCDEKPSVKSRRVLELP
jgi:hypothetical protein